MTAGRFITFEGGEGAGKSTQISLLAERLRAHGIEPVTTREPGGSPGAEEIRALLVTGARARWDGISEVLLHFAARRDHLVRTIWPSLAAGRWVLCDRFADSTMAYQGYGHGLGDDVVRQLYRLTVGDFSPDLTIILDVPTELGLARAHRRRGSEDRYEGMGADFHLRLREAFRTIAQEEPARCRLIDGNRSRPAVANDIWQAVAKHFGLAP